MIKGFENTQHNVFWSHQVFRISAMDKVNSVQGRYMKTSPIKFIQKVTCHIFRNINMWLIKFMC